MIITGGVDPGLSGAAAAVSSAGTLLWYLDFEDFVDDAGTGLDPVKLFPALKSIFAGASLVVLERPSAMPPNRDPRKKQKGQGVASAFNFGSTCGLVYGLLVGAGFTVIRPRPGVWKAAMGLSADKELCTAKAAELFPASRHSFYGPRGGAKHDRAEAALLAQYGQRFAREKKTTSRLI